MIIVPIGIDCGVSLVMKKYNLRKISLPFDWVVSYKGIKEILENDFKEYIPESAIYKEGTDIVVYNKYDVKFIHDKFDEEDNNKYKRRIERLKNILETNTDYIYFIKKGHSYHHHGEYNFIDDIVDVKELNKYIKDKYPKLSYKIILILLCNNCYKNIDINKIDENIIIIKEPIIDIRDNLIHNKIITGNYFEYIFVNKVIEIIK